MGEDLTLILMFLTIIVGLYWVYKTPDEDQNLEDTTT